VVTTWTGRSNRHTSQEEQALYDHLLYWVELESPEKLIERFHALFIDGSRYTDTQVAEILDRIVCSRIATEEFRFILNRCCHILINRWQSRLQSQQAIPELVRLFELKPQTSASLYRSKAVRRLRELTHSFIQTEQYLTLHRLAQVLTEASESSSTNRSLGTFISRYPYLYEHCLLSEDSTYEQQQTIKELQASRQHQFEINLSQYITYQVRRRRAATQVSASLPPRNIYPVANPTLLVDQELGQALKQYAGRVYGNKTHRDLAHSFLAQNDQTTTFKAFKDDLYQYLTAAIDPEYGKRQFNNQLYLHLQNVLPDNHTHRLNDFLLVRTCAQLLGFLVVDNPQRPNHFVFVDLITNLGSICVTSLLLKIILICRKVKPYLERRLSILFSHYESQERQVVEWLINMLEHVNIALSVHFGAVDMSLIR